MAVNLYDSPAQARFINTYVPMQFEDLYRVSDRAQKDLEKSEAYLDEALKYSDLNTLSDADKNTWNTRVYGPMKQLVDEIFTNGDALKDKGNQAKLAAGVRRIKMDPTATLLVNKDERFREFSKKSDPRWGDIEKNIPRNWNSLENGTFDKANTQYLNYGEASNPFVDKLEKTYLGKTKDGRYNINGISESSISNAIDGGLSQIVSNKSIQMRVLQDKISGRIPTEYIQKDKSGKYLTDENGQPLYNEVKYARDMEYNAQKDRAHLDYDADPYKMKDYDFMYWRKQKELSKEDEPGTISPATIAIEKYQEQLKRQQKNAAIELAKKMATGRVTSSGASGTKVSPVIFSYKGYIQAENGYNNANKNLQSVMSNPNSTRADISAANTNLANAKQNLDKVGEIVRMEYTTMARKVINGERVPGISKEEAYEMFTAPVDQELVRFNLTTIHGKPDEISVDKEMGVSAYDPGSISNYTISNPRTGVPLSEKGAVVSKFTNAYKNGKFTSGVKFVPASDGIGSDNGIKLKGVLMVPKETFNTYVTRDDKELKAANINVRSVSKYDADGMLTTTAEYVEIPVTKDMDIDLGATTGGMVNAEFNTEKIRKGSNNIIQ